MSHQQPIQFGYPEFWPTVVAEYPEFFARAKRLENALSSVIDRGYDEGLDQRQHLLHSMLTLVALGFNEVITLVGNGMGLGAMKIVRNMLENAINAAYIQKFPEQAEKYLEWHWVEDRNKLRNWQRNSPDLLKQISAQTQLRTTKEYKRVQHLFTYQVRNAKGEVETKLQREWCRDRLFDRADKTDSELASIHNTVMSLANQILHGSIDGLLGYMNSADSDGRLERIPNMKYASHALIAAHGATLKTLETVALALGASPDPDVNSLTDDYAAIWTSKPQQEVL